MNEDERKVKMKYLALMRGEVRLQYEALSLVKMSHMSKKDQYKLMKEHNAKVQKIIDKFTKLTMKEIELLKAKGNE